MAGIREFMDTPRGKAVSIGFVIVAVAAMGYFVWTTLGSSPASFANQRVFIDAATGKPFAYDIRDGDSIPVTAPSGGKTGYPAERCYWTADGKVKDEPTYVLLQESLGKPGPTFCPDCGRLVRYHNPMAVEGNKPPPTEAELGNRRPAAPERY